MKAHVFVSSSRQTSEKDGLHISGQCPQQWNCRTCYLYWDQKACTLINQTPAEMTHWTLHPHIRRMSTRLQHVTYTAPLLLTQEKYRPHFEPTFKQDKPDKTQQHGLRSMEAKKYSKAQKNSITTAERPLQKLAHHHSGTLDMQRGLGGAVYLWSKPTKLGRA